MALTGDGVTTCPSCGARFPSPYAQGCIRCGWKKPFQHYPHSETESAEPAPGSVPSSPTDAVSAGAVPPTARPWHKKLIIAAGCLLMLLALAVAGFYGYGHFSKEQGEAEQQRVRQQYGRLLTEAKNRIFSAQLEPASKSLQDALDLPGASDRSEATLLLAEVKKASSPIEPLVSGLSDTELAAICKSGSLPPAYQLTYVPLDEQYRRKVLLACYKEQDRREAAAKAEKMASLQRAEAERKAQEAKAEAERKATEPNVSAQQSGAGDTATAGTGNVAAKVKLVSGATVSGTITDCQGGEIKMRFEVAADNPSAILQRKYPCADIASIDLATADAALQKKIVKAALVVGNGVLAHGMACSMSNDPAMKALSENPDLIKAVSDVRTATTAYPLLAKRVSDTEARIADLTKQIALARQRAQRVSLSADRDSLNNQLPDMKAQRDAARTACERAQTALKGLCQDVLKKAFSNEP